MKARNLGKTSLTISKAKSSKLKVIFWERFEKVPLSMLLRNFKKINDEF
jgi:hypothetical protein